MKQKDEASKKGGIGFFGALTILFIGLKLTGYIDWSWWVVLAPTWAPNALALVIILGAFAHDKLTKD